MKLSEPWTKHTGWKTLRAAPLLRNGISVRGISAGPKRNRQLLILAWLTEEAQAARHSPWAGLWGSRRSLVGSTGGFPSLQDHSNFQFCLWNSSTPAGRKNNNGVSHSLGPCHANHQFTMSKLVTTSWNGSCVLKTSKTSRLCSMLYIRFWLLVSWWVNAALRISNSIRSTSSRILRSSSKSSFDFPSRSVGNKWEPAPIETNQWARVAHAMDELPSVGTVVLDLSSVRTRVRRLLRTQSSVTNRWHVYGCNRRKYAAMLASVAKQFVCKYLSFKIQIQTWHTQCNTRATQMTRTYKST